VITNTEVVAVVVLAVQVETAAITDMNIMLQTAAQELLPTSLDLYFILVVAAEADLITCLPEAVRVE
jgi:hypothetical protein